MLLIGCSDNDSDNNDYPNDYYFWESLGSPGTGWGTRFSMSIDLSDNKPIVTFVNMLNNHRPQVKKWSAGTSWTDLGFLTGAMGDHPALTIDPSDYKPVVVFVDNVINGQAHVKKWSSGTIWTDLGYPSNQTSEDLSIAMDPTDNKLVVAFRDWATPGAAADVHVKKWSSCTSWTGLGWPSEGTSCNPSVAIDPADNKPVVMYSDSAGADAKVYVAKQP
jgi:hypothetical protein